MRSKLLLIVGILACCYTTVSCKKKKETGSVKAVVSVAEKTASAYGLSDELNLTEDTLGDYNRVSFTPESLKLSFTGINLCTGSTLQGGENEGPTCSGSGNSFITINEKKEIELVGASQFAELFSATAEVDEEKFGDYNGFFILTDDMPIVKVTGSYTRGGVTYEMDEVEIELGSNIGAYMETPMKVEADSEPVVRLYFDVDKALFLHSFGQTCSTEFGNVGQLTDPKGCVSVRSVGFLPFMGNTNPTIETYELTITSEYIYKDTLKLRILFMLDEKGNIAGINWVPVYATNFYAGPGWAYPMEPCSIYNVKDNITTNADGSFKIDSDQCHEELILSLPSFKLEDHSGSLTYGGKTYSYTAEKKS